MYLEEKCYFKNKSFVKVDEISENFWKIGLIYMIDVDSKEELEQYIDGWLIPNQSQEDQIKVFVSRVLESYKERCKSHIFEIGYHINQETKPIKHQLVENFKLGNIFVVEQQIEKIALEMKDSEYGLSKLQILRDNLRHKLKAEMGTEMGNKYLLFSQHLVNF
jgi:hypothetical protein